MGGIVPRQRFRQIMLLAGLACLSWLGMMLVHEFGHVVGAWLSGGQVQHVTWHPTVFSSTYVEPNPQPLLVVWCGPLIGVLLPLCIAGLIRGLKLSTSHLFTFFAGFCLIANGTYIALGSFEGIADAGDMLWLGTPQWVLVVFGVVTVPAGFWLWHLASPKLGFGKSPQAISAAHAYGSFIAGAALVIIATAFGSRGI